MDVGTIDQQFGQLQAQGQQTAQALQTLGGKLQSAAQNGDPQAREWLLDLRELALSFRDEQSQVSALLQSLHGFVAAQAQTGGFGGAPSPNQQPAPYNNQPMPQQTYAPQPGYAAPAPSGGGMGGMLGSFLNSGFGRAIETGAGFGIGDELIKDIF